MIRIPTGKVSANTARTVSVLLGAAAGAVSLLAPQYAWLFQPIALVLAPLGITLGDARKAP